jgi:hypothetical protein
MYYNANSKLGNGRYLFPIKVHQDLHDIEIHISFRNEIQRISMDKYGGCNYFWLQTNELPDNILLHTKSCESGMETYYRFTPTHVHRGNLKRFLELLSLRFKPSSLSRL